MHDGLELPTVVAAVEPVDFDWGVADTPTAFAEEEAVGFAEDELLISLLVRVRASSFGSPSSASMSS